MEQEIIFMFYMEMMQEQNFVAALVHSNVVQFVVLGVDVHI